MGRGRKAVKYNYPGTAQREAEGAGIRTGGEGTCVWLLKFRGGERRCRVIGIVLMSLTAAFTLLGGIGTTCVALNPTGFGGKFAGIAPFQWLYILFVIVTTAVGAWAVRVVVQLVRGEKGSYRRALIVLAAGILVGGVHTAASRSLRGSSMPVDMVVYTTILTLVVFLLFRLPGVRQQIGLERGDGGGMKGQAAAAIALAATGLLTLTVQFLHGADPLDRRHQLLGRVAPDAFGARKRAAVRGGDDARAAAVRACLASSPGTR